jgi:serine/threonine protein kinase
MAEMVEPKIEPISQAQLERAALSLADRVEPWRSGSYTMVQALQEAPCNHGRVDAFQRSADNLQVCIKRMPNWWVRKGHGEFQESHGKQSERPWQDLGLLAEMRSRGCPYTCELLGIFRDELMTYVVTTLGSHGDLFTWCKQAPEHGPAREAAARPIAAQLLPAARFLHDAGVCHRDLTVENIVLAGSLDQLQVKIIDFGMAGLGRMQGGPSQGHRPKGKKAYQSPETHCLDRAYDSFLADDFALGVVLYAMTVTDYPWSTTAPGRSEEFERARQSDMAAFLAKEADASCGRSQVLSLELLDMLAGLLSVEPAQRHAVGEACYSQEGRGSAQRSVWLLSELQADRPIKPDLSSPISRNSTCATLSTIDSDGEDDSEEVYHI